MNSKRVFVLTLLSVLVAFSVPAVVLGAASGPPAEDAAIYINDPTLNQNAEHLRAEAGDPICAQSRWSFLKWNLADIAPGTTIGSATMGFYVNLVSGDTANAFLTLYEVNDDSWSESTINYSNAPSRGAIIQSVAIPLANNWVTFSDPNLISFLQQEADGDNVASFALGVTGNCGNASVLVRMWSKDSPAANTPDPYLNMSAPNAVTLNTFRSDNSAVSPVILAGAGIALLAGVVGIIVARRRRLAN